MFDEQDVLLGGFSHLVLFKSKKARPCFEVTSDVALLFDRLQRGTLHEELHQLGSDLLGVRVCCRVGRRCDSRLGG